MTDPLSFPFDGETCFGCRDKTPITAESRPYQNADLTKAGYENLLCRSCAYFFSHGGYRLVKLIEAMIEQSKDAPEKPMGER